MRAKLISCKYDKGYLKWWLFDDELTVFSHKTRPPFKDYCFGTEDQAYLIDKMYEKIKISRCDPQTHKFADHSKKDKEVWKIEFPRPFMKEKVRKEMEKDFSELISEADVNYIELIMKDLKIFSSVEVDPDVIMPIADFNIEIPHVMFDIETDDRSEIIAKSKLPSEQFAKTDVARILSCSFLDMKTGQLEFLTDLDEKTLLLAMKDKLYQYIWSEAWNGRSFDYKFVERRMRHHKIPFTWDRFFNIDAMLIHEMLNPKERKFLAIDRIAQKYLDMRKIRHTEGFYTMFDNYHNETNKLLEEYNNRDVEIMGKLEDKFGFAGVVMETSFSTGMFPSKYTYARKPSQTLIRRKSMNDNGVRYVWKSKSDIPETIKFEGATVQDPIAGRWKNVLAVDLRSLYNLIIQTFNISPELLQIFDDQEPLFFITHDSDDELLPHPIPIYPHDYKRVDKDGIMRITLQEVEVRRNKFKDIMKASKGEKFKLYDMKQQGEKAVLLSLYGGLGARGSTNAKEGGFISGRKEFYDFYCADDVTRYAREIIAIAVRITEFFGYKVVYGDTDSIYIYIGEKDFSNAEVEQIMNDLLEGINYEYGIWLTDLGIPKKWQKIRMEAQGFYSPFIVFDKKKNYVAREVWNAENNIWHEDFEMYGKGLKPFKPSATDFHKRFLKEYYKMMLTYKSKSDVNEYIKQNYEDLLNNKYEHELVFEKKLTKLMKDYVNKTADIKYANTLIKAGKLQEKGAIYFKYGYVAGKIGVVCINEFDTTQFSGRKYFWEKHMKGDVDELMDIVFPIEHQRLDDWF